MKNLQQIVRLKWISYLLAAFIILRLLLTLIIFYWDVPQTDDFCFMARMHEYGTWGSIKWWYLNWQGRVLPQIMTNFVLIQYGQFDNMLLYGIILLSLFIFSLYRVIYKLLEKLGYILDTFEKFLLSILAASIFCIILDFHNDTSTLYWINVSTMYFAGTAFFILGISELLNNKESVKSYTLITFSFIYAGCSSEHFGILTLGFLILSYIIQRYFTTFEVDYFNGNKLKWAISSCLISFLIMYFAPGNDFRMASIDHPSFEEGLKNISSFSKILYFNRLSVNAGYLIFGFFIAFLTGSHFSDKIKVKQYTLQQLLAVSFMSLMYFTIGTIIIFGFLTTYKGPSRAFIHISTFVVSFFCLLGFIVGLFSQPKQMTFFKPLALFIILVYGSTIAYQFSFNLTPTIQYAQSVRSRLMLVQKQSSGIDSILILPKLVNNNKNLLWDGELATDQNDTNLFWANKCLNTAYGFGKSHIIVVDSTVQSLKNKK